MECFSEQFEAFLDETGLTYSKSCSPIDKNLSCYQVAEKNLAIILVPLKIAADYAIIEQLYDKIISTRGIHSESQKTPSQAIEYLFLYEDVWLYNKEIIKERIALRLGTINSIFARKCTIINSSNSNPTHQKLKKFIESHHSLGYVKSPYLLGLSHKESIVAAASFSKPIVTTREIGGEKRKLLSFEWTRYASLSDTSVVGGMGKLLQRFNDCVKREIQEGKYPLTNGIEIMSYSDNEWSSGRAYEKLRFIETEGLPPIAHYVDLANYERVSTRVAARWMQSNNLSTQNGQFLKIFNMGSRKWLLSLKD